MADTTTTNYSLVKPEIGASEDTWGTKLNTNLDGVDTQMKVNADATAVADAKAVDAQEGADLSLKIASNLSDINSVTVARTNLGLGSAAQSDASTFATAAQGVKADSAAPLDSPALTGNPTAPTPTASDNSTSLATTAYVDGAVTSATSTVFTSTETASFPTVGSKTSVSHGLGDVPTRISARAVCQVSSGGYSVGDEIDLGTVLGREPYHDGHVLGCNSTSVFLVLSTSAVNIPTSTGVGVLVLSGNASWGLVFRAELQS